MNSTPAHDCRAEFEKWCHADLAHDPVKLERYRANVANQAWHVWQAAWNAKPTEPARNFEPENLRLNVAKAIEYTIKYYKAEVGDRMENVYDVVDAVLLEVNPYLQYTSQIAKIADSFFVKYSSKNPTTTAGYKQILDLLEKP